MIDLAVYNLDGQEVDSLKVDEAAFGGYDESPYQAETSPDLLALFVKPA